VSGTSYVEFPVRETIEIKDLSEVIDLVSKMVKLYQDSYQIDNFSFRLLLPRGDKETDILSKKIGIAIQTELLLALRKNNLTPNIKHVRYVHDDAHYGWVLASPKLHYSFESLSDR
jgi:hypothetical protein